MVRKRVSEVERTITRRNFLKFAGGGIAGVTVLGAASCGGSGGQGEDSGGQVDSLLIGTAGEGGTFYFVGQGMAQAIEQNTDLSATSQRTAGGTENIRRLSSGGDMDMGMVTPADIQLTLEDGTVEASNVRVLMSGHASVNHVVVREDSRIESLDELLVEDRRISVGEPGSGIRDVSQALLSAYGGLELEDIDAQELSASQSATALIDGSIEGTVLGGGVPQASVSEIGTQVGARVLNWPEDERFNEYQQLYSGVFMTEIPGGTYEGTPDTVQSPGIPTVLLVRADLSDEVVAEMTRTFIENAEGIEQVHPSGAEYTLENAFRGADYYINEMGLEFHPGAVEYFKEEGVWSENYE